MSVPYKLQQEISDFSEPLVVSSIPQPRASDKIPMMARPFVSERAKKTLDIVEKFVEEECVPADAMFNQQLGEGTERRFSSHPAIMNDLKIKARERGLWNMFLPRNHFKEGAGFSNLEYGLMAEHLGKSLVASEATNCAAPDTGNMEVIAKYGTEEQKKKWLRPLLEGEIRSAFLMTEPDVASSDATNIELEIRKEGNEYVLNGFKWWSSGAGDTRCRIYITMGKTDKKHLNAYKQQSIIFVPANTPGITIQRMLSVFGYDDAPHGHGHITFKNVRVPAENMILGEGRGFEIIQGRLGPGRIHHAMRSIGAAERALELYEYGVMLERVARSRIEIDAARLQVLNAAITIDSKDAKFALKEIAEAKVTIPTMALAVIDRAIQAYGGAGVAQDTPLANMYAHGRTMRIVDGPDEVHLKQLGSNENKRGKYLLEKMTWQDSKTDQLAKTYSITRRDRLQLDRVSEKSKL